MRLSVLVGLFAFSSASVGSVQAQTDPNESARRRVVAPYIRALTDCIAQTALRDQDAATYYRYGGFGGYLGRQLSKCPTQFEALLQHFEETYGDGATEQFIKGPYLNDLERAVLVRIKPQMELKMADLDRADRTKKAEDDAKLAEANRKQEEERIQTIKLEAEKKAAEARAAQERQERIDTAKRAMSVLKDKFYECTDRELKGLVKSGESADVLASAAITICGQPLSQLQDAAVEEFGMENSVQPNGDTEDAVRAQIKSLVKESVVASAVMAKAGTGTFSRESFQSAASRDPGPSQLDVEKARAAANANAAAKIERTLNQSVLESNPSGSK